MRTEKLIKISEMAALHGVSRQTLILYDKKGLFKPVKVADNGYRYYSVDQIPRLRQICLLKEIGVPLAEIRAHLESPSPDGMHAILVRRQEAIREELDKLSLQLGELEQLDHIFAGVTTKEKNVDMPHLVSLPERKAILAPFDPDAMDVKRLHLALMDAWGQLLEAGAIPSQGFGALLDAKALGSDQPLAGAGSIVFMPREVPVEGCEVVTLPAGEYVCMYKHAMPYDLEPVRRLLAWMGGRGLVPAGLVVDRCLLDSVFYNERRTSDFCRLEVLLAG